MRRSLFFVVLALLLVFAADAAHAQRRGSIGRKHWYIGLLGVGASVTAPAAREINLDWGLKGEGGYLDDIGFTMQALLRLNLPTDSPKFFVQLGVGAVVHTGADFGNDRWGNHDDLDVDPAASLGFGARIEDWTLLLQFPGYPIIGVMFPM